MREIELYTKFNQSGTFIARGVASHIKGETALSGAKNHSKNGRLQGVLNFRGRERWSKKIGNIWRYFDKTKKHPKKNRHYLGVNSS